MSGPALAETPELELVHRAIRGELPAFEELMARYQRAVFNIALYKSRNYFDAEDLTQEIFLAAFNALSSLKAPESFAGWLFGIAYNRCHKWFHREKHKIVKFEELKQRVAREERLRQRTGSGDVTGRGGSPPLSEVFSRLPSEIRETITLKYLEGLSYEEIEQRLGINAHRIDYLIRKGKQMIRDRLAAANGDPPPQ